MACRMHEAHISTYPDSNTIRQWSSWSSPWYLDRNLENTGCHTCPQLHLLKLQTANSYSGPPLHTPILPAILQSSKIYAIAEDTSNCWLVPLEKKKIQWLMWPHRSVAVILISLNCSGILYFNFSLSNLSNWGVIMVASTCGVPSISYLTPGKQVMVTMSVKTHYHYTHMRNVCG